MGAERPPMELWVGELQLGNMNLSLRARATLHREVSEFQEILVADTFAFGRVLMLDGTFQVTEKDEFLYHEMLTHPAMMAHPRPERVLVIGGGDGGTIREVVRHPEVQKAVLCEIDPRVTAVCREYLPEVASGLSDPRVEVLHQDGVRYIQDHPGEFDVILIDSTDPVGPAIGLYSEEFYAACRQALRPGGIVCAQSESPLVNGDVVRLVNVGMRAVFAHTLLYLGPLPTYPSGLWSYTMGSGSPIATDVDRARAEQLAARYYTADLHRSLQALPPFAAALL